MAGFPKARLVVTSINKTFMLRLIPKKSTKRLVHLWYWLCYYLRIHHQCCHLLHSQQQRGCGVDIYWIVWLCLHTMVQSRRGATQRVEVQTHPTYPLTKVISRFIQPIEPQQQRGCGVDIYWIVWQVFQALDYN
jgi:hypothetical protein